jgi:hypothetical protein
MVSTDSPNGPTLDHLSGPPYHPLEVPTPHHPDPSLPLEHYLLAHSYTGPDLPCLGRRQAYVSLVPSDLVCSSLFTPTYWFKTHPILPRTTSCFVSTVKTATAESLLTTTTPPPIPTSRTSIVAAPTVPSPPRVMRDTLFSLALSLPLTLLNASPPSTPFYVLTVSRPTLPPSPPVNVFLSSSDPFPLLSGKRRTSWMRQITPLSTALTLDVQLVFPPSVPT